MARSAQLWRTVPSGMLQRNRHRTDGRLAPNQRTQLETRGRVAWHRIARQPAEPTMLAAGAPLMTGNVLAYIEIV